MKFKEYIRDAWRSNMDLASHIDAHAAELSIRSNVYFRGPTVLILAFSIVIASVGLNVNSIPVVIGAMLISPLMGPIIGVGLSGAINDGKLFRDSAWNLLVMVLISLLASALYFLLSPLELANPTELEARTSPSLYDVLIAFFGGAAGIVEQARKEKGTVLSGVAIATALMPPLCTAGYGIAHWSGHFFFGAMGLFGINALFIALATYIGAKLMHFPQVVFIDSKTARRTHDIVFAVVVVVIALSVWSAFLMVGNNNFERNSEAFVAENRSLDKAYIYDYKIDAAARKLEIRVTGRQITPEQRESLEMNAQLRGIPKGSLVITENSLDESTDFDRSERLVNLFEKSEAEIAVRDAKIMMLREQVDSLKGAALPTRQIVRELGSQYPDTFSEVFISRGTAVETDSLGTAQRTSVIVRAKRPLKPDETARLEEWLKIRLTDENLDLFVVPE